MAKKVAGELYESITGQLFELGRQLRQPNGYPFDPHELQRALQQAIEGRFKAAVSAPETATPTLVLHKTVSLGGVKAKKTRDCLSGKLWVYHDSDIDSWLPKRQSAQLAGSVGIYQLQNPKGTTFREMALAVTQITPGASDEEIVARLKEIGLTLTLPEIEAMVDRHESGEGVGLRADGYANFAFVEDANGGVSVLRCYRLDRRWYASVGRLGYGGRWCAGFRLLLRNSDARNL